MADSKKHTHGNICLGLVPLLSHSHKETIGHPNRRTPPEVFSLGGPLTPNPHVRYDCRILEDIFVTLLLPNCQDIVLLSDTPPENERLEPKMEVWFR